MRITLALSIVMLVISCKSKKEMTASSGEKMAQDTLEMVASDMYGGAEEEVFQVIRTEGELHKFYRQVNMTRKPGLAVPKIDFSAHTAILYCSGSTRSTSMPRFYVASQSDEDIVVAKAIVPESDSTTTVSAKLTPFGLYLLPFTDKEVILSQK